MFFVIVNDYDGTDSYKKNFKTLLEYITPPKPEKPISIGSSIVILDKKNQEIVEFKVERILTKKPKYQIKILLKKVKKLEYSKSDFEYLMKNYFGDINLNFLKSSKIAKHLLNNDFIVKDTIQFLKKIKDYSKTTGINLYRGHKDATWEILPSIHRKKENIFDFQEKEKELYFNIRKNNFVEFSVQENFINEIIHMQHYGIPTPLVDWTSNPLIALFFSLDESKNDGRVFLTNKTRIINFSEDDYKKVSEILESIFRNDRTKIRDEHMEIILQDEDLFIETINENPRIAAQKGLFSISFKPYRFSKNIKEYLFNKILETINFIATQELEDDKQLNIFKSVFIAKKDDVTSKIKNLIDNDLRDKNREKEIEKFTKEVLNQIINTVNHIESKNKISESQQQKIQKKVIEFLNIKLNVTFSQNSTEKALIVLEEDKKKLKLELEHLLGITAVNVYPDITGYIEYIKENF